MLCKLEGNTAEYVTDREGYVSYGDVVKKNQLSKIVEIKVSGLGERDRLDLDWTKITGLKKIHFLHCRIPNYTFPKLTFENLEEVVYELSTINNDCTYSLLNACPNLTKFSRDEDSMQNEEFDGDLEAQIEAINSPIDDESLDNSRFVQETGRRNIGDISFSPPPHYHQQNARTSPDSGSTEGDGLSVGESVITDIEITYTIGLRTTRISASEYQYVEHDEKARITEMHIDGGEKFDEILGYNILEGCDSLEFLTISNASITNTYMDSFPTFDHLKKINIENCDIEDEGVMRLLPRERANANPIRLSLVNVSKADGGPFEEDEFLYLQQTLSEYNPNLQIVADFTSKEDFSFGDEEEKDEEDTSQASTKSGISNNSRMSANVINEHDAYSWDPSADEGDEPSVDQSVRVSRVNQPGARDRFNSAMSDISGLSDIGNDKNSLNISYWMLGEATRSISNTKFHNLSPAQFNKLAPETRERIGKIEIVSRGTENILDKVNFGDCTNVQSLVIENAIISGRETNEPILPNLKLLTIDNCSVDVLGIGNLCAAGVPLVHLLQISKADGSVFNRTAVSGDEFELFSRELTRNFPDIEWTKGEITVATDTDDEESFADDASDASLTTVSRGSLDRQGTNRTHTSFPLGGRFTRASTSFPRRDSIDSSLGSSNSPLLSTSQSNTNRNSRPETSFSSSRIPLNLEGIEWDKLGDDSSNANYSGSPSFENRGRSAQRPMARGRLGGATKQAEFSPASRTGTNLHGRTDYSTRSAVDNFQITVQDSDGFSNVMNLEQWANLTPTDRQKIVLLAVESTDNPIEKLDLSGLTELEYLVFSNTPVFGALNEEINFPKLKRIEINDCAVDIAALDSLCASSSGYLGALNLYQISTISEGGERVPFDESGLEWSQIIRLLSDVNSGSYQRRESDFNSHIGTEANTYPHLSTSKVNTHKSSRHMGPSFGESSSIDENTVLSIASTVQRGADTKHRHRASTEPAAMHDEPVILCFLEGGERFYNYSAVKEAGLLDRVISLEFKGTGAVGYPLNIGVDWSKLTGLQSLKFINTNVKGIPFFRTTSSKLFPNLQCLSFERCQVDSFALASFIDNSDDIQEINMSKDTAIEPGLESQKVSKIMAQVNHKSGSVHRNYPPPPPPFTMGRPSITAVRAKPDNRSKMGLFSGHPSSPSQKYQEMAGKIKQKYNHSRALHEQTDKEHKGQVRQNFQHLAQKYKQQTRQDTDFTTDAENRMDIRSLEEIVEHIDDAVLKHIKIEPMCYTADPDELTDEVHLSFENPQTHRKTPILTASSESVTVHKSWRRDLDPHQKVSLKDKALLVLGSLGIPPCPPDIKIDGDPNSRFVKEIDKQFRKLQESPDEEAIDVKVSKIRRST